MCSKGSVPVARCGGTIQGQCLDSIVCRQGKYGKIVHTRVCGGGGKKKDKESSRSEVSILCGNKPERANVVLFWEPLTFHACSVCVSPGRNKTKRGQQYSPLVECRGDRTLTL